MSVVSCYRSSQSQLPGVEVGKRQSIVNGKAKQSKTQNPKPQTPKGEKGGGSGAGKSKGTSPRDHFHPNPDRSAGPSP